MYSSTLRRIQRSAIVCDWLMVGGWEQMLSSEMLQMIVFWLMRDSS